jgi:hypothetical protein
MDRTKVTLNKACSKYAGSTNARTEWAREHAGEEVEVVSKENEALPSTAVIAKDGTENEEAQIPATRK